MKMLKYRSDQPEMMDDPATDRRLLQKNLQELDFLNRYFGGNDLVLNGLKKLVSRKRASHVVDLGCGSGDLLKYIARWARKNKVKLTLTGVDRNIHAIRYLKRHCIGFPEISGVIMDYDDYLKSEPVADIYLCSLFCHHLNDTQLLELFKYLKRAKTGFIISDLHRSALAYYSARAFTWIFNGTVLSRNDGPVSVLKAFKRKELEQMLEQSGITNYTIRQKWAFRFQIIVKN